MGVGRDRRRRFVAAALLLSLAACSDAAGGSPSRSLPSPVDTGSSAGPAADAPPGGELQVLNSRDFEFLDPARNYSRNAGNAGRLVTRTLTMVREQAGQSPRIIGDLARDWRPGDGNRTWTFRLKPGVKYEDGTPVSARDVKYGVERSFAPALTEGAPYARRYLAGAASYLGPYMRGNNGGRGLSSIVVSGPDTITFRLTEPVADFPWVTSTFTFSPVPAAADTREAYDDRPLATGPYRIESYLRGQRLVLVRNPHWDQGTDGYRSALPDRFEFALGQDATTISRRLIAGEPDTQNALTQDADVPDEDVPELDRPDLAARTVGGSSLCIRYLALNGKKPPLSSVKARAALQYAIDKQEVSRLRGGPRKADVLSGIIPQGMLGYRNRSFFPVPSEGDEARARRLLAEAGLVLPAAGEDRGETTPVAAEAPGRAGAALTPTPRGAAAAETPLPTTVAETPTPAGTADTPPPAGAVETPTRAGSGFPRPAGTGDGTQAPPPTTAAVEQPRLVIAAGEQGRARAAAEAVAASLREIGFETEIRSAPKEASYTGPHPRAPDLVLAGWCPDWPSPTALLPPLLGPETFAQPTGKASRDNVGGYDNPGDWAEMKRIAQEVSDPRRAAEAWASLHARLLQRAPVVPLVQDRSLFVVGAKVVATETTPTFGGQVDLVKVGVRR